MEIIGLGSVAMDVIMQVNKLPREDDFCMIEKTTYLPGGSCANVMVQTARLGVDSGFIGMISDDKLGKDIVSEFVKEKINIEAMPISQGGTTIHTNIVVDMEGKKFIMVDGGDVFYQIQPEDVDMDYISQARILYTDLFPSSTCVEVVKRVKDKGITTVFNMQAGLPTYEAMGAGKEMLLDVLQYIDVFSPCKNGLYDLAGTNNLEHCHHFIRQYFDGLLLVTLGNEGSVAWDKADKEYRVAKVDVEVVDTTGAGDSFIGTFMDRYCLKNMPLQAAMQVASACAAYTCMSLGARTSPFIEEARAFCSEKGIDFGT